MAKRGKGAGTRTCGSALTETALKSSCHLIRCFFSRMRPLEWHLNG